jgi:hypothetical protein
MLSGRSAQRSAASASSATWCASGFAEAEQVDQAGGVEEAGTVVAVVIPTTHRVTGEFEAVVGGAAQD